MNSSKFGFKKLLLLISLHVNIYENFFFLYFSFRFEVFFELVYSQIIMCLCDNDFRGI